MIIIILDADVCRLLNRRLGTSDRLQVGSISVVQDELFTSTVATSDYGSICLLSIRASDFTWRPVVLASSCVCERIAGRSGGICAGK
jgi:hypothetical protein